MAQRKFKIYLFNKCVGASQFVRSVDLTPNFYYSCSVLKKEGGARHGGPFLLFVFCT
jgi:hypothetical protein